MPELRPVARLRNPERFEIRFLDRVIAAGRADPVSIYEVCAADPEPMRSQKRRSAAPFAAGVAHYARGDFASASESFRESLGNCAEDSAAMLYVDRCAAENPRFEDGWTGITRLSSK